MTKRDLACACVCGLRQGRWDVLLDCLAGVGGRQLQVRGPAGRGKQGARVGTLPGPGAARLVAAAGVNPSLPPDCPQSAHRRGEEVNCQQ